MFDPKKFQKLRKAYVAFASAVRFISTVRDGVLFAYEEEDLVEENKNMHQELIKEIESIGFTWDLVDV